MPDSQNQSPVPLNNGGWGPAVRNFIRWTVLLIVGAGTGMLVCVVDPGSKHQFWDFLRAAAITEIPVIAALRTQLEKALGIGG